MTDSASTLVSDAALCPICREFMAAPVSLPCGHTYCDYCLREWAERPGCAHCPLCQKPVPSPFPSVNLALRDLMTQQWPVEAATAQEALSKRPRRRRTVAAYNFRPASQLPMHFDMAVALYCAEHKITDPDDQRCVALALYAHLGGHIKNKCFPLTHVVSGTNWDMSGTDDMLLAMASVRWNALSGSRKYNLRERLPPCFSSIWWPHLRAFAVRDEAEMMRRVEAELCRN